MTRFLSQLSMIAFSLVAPLLVAGHGGAQEADMVFVPPIDVNDDVWLTEGYAAPEDAARAGADEAYARARASSSRPDRLPEQEYGGVVYQAADGSFGYTTPRSDAGWAGEPNAGSAANKEPFTSVYSSRGVAERGDDGEWRLLTPEGQRVVAQYHIHPDEPMDGTVMDEASRRGPSWIDRQLAASTGLDQYALGPDGFARVTPTQPPDSPANMFVLQEEAIAAVEPQHRRFICNADPNCDRGRDASCTTANGQLTCEALTERSCLRIERMPPEAFSRAGGSCASALRSLRDKEDRPTKGQESTGGGLGGLGGGIANALNELGGTLEKLAAGVEVNCSLPKPICPPT